MLRQKKNMKIYGGEKSNPTQLEQMIQLEEINQKVMAKEGISKRYRDRIKNTDKTGHSKTTKENSIGK